jgi:hypothetical protein
MKTGWLAIIIAVMCPLTARAEPRSMEAYGHHIAIHAGSDGNEVLEVDDKVLLSELHIDIENVGKIGDDGFAIGSTNQGGNVCEGSTFILNLPDGAAARIDGPLDTCKIGNVRVQASNIVVETPPLPSRDGRHWEWTSQGFSEPSPVKLKLKQGMAWQMVRQQQIKHPSELMEYREFADQLNPRLGSLRPAFLRIAEGPGSVRYENGMLIGTACQSHACDSTALLVAVDPGSRNLYVAIKDNCAPAVIVPEPAMWPLAAQRSLRSWYHSAPVLDERVRSTRAATA